MHTAKFKIGQHLIRVLLVIWSIMVIYPIVWVMYSSLKDNRDFYKSPWDLPSVLHFENYYNAWVTSRFSEYFLNSILVVAAALVLSLLMSTTTSYIFAKYKIKLLRIFENTYLAAMMIPSVLLLIPLFFQAQKMHMTNSLWGLIILYSIQGVPFAVFMLTGFFKGVHDSYIEAAVIDGCSEFRLFFTIAAPMVKSGIFIVAMLNIMGSWNEYVLALTFLTDEAKFTVPIGISYLSSTMQYRTDFGALFAGLVIGMLPLLIVYGLLQKQLQEGMAASSGVKG